MLMPSTLKAAVAVAALSMPLLPAAASETIAYTYDAQGRLIKVAITGNTNNGTQVVYQPDNADNRVRVTVTGSPNPPPH